MTASSELDASTGPSTPDDYLRPFADAGVLSSADTQVARRLGKLGGEANPIVLLAAAMTVRAVRHGSVCLHLNTYSDVPVDTTADDSDCSTSGELVWPSTEEMTTALLSSCLVGRDTDGGEACAPLVMVPGSEPLLYLARYYRQERAIRTILTERAGIAVDYDEQRLATSLRAHFGSEGDDHQRDAARTAVTSLTMSLVGGPGTGKTRTIARIVVALIDQHGPQLRIALAAPTGKAAARLQDELNAQTVELGLPPLASVTLHRLLGWLPGNKFRHNANNKLPFDVVIVDETSMVSVTLMCRLLEAVSTSTRLILVGDPHQLASVEAGAVLSDVTEMPDVVPAVRLTRNYRNADSGIPGLARAIQRGGVDEVLSILESGIDGVHFVDASVNSVSLDAEGGDATVGAGLHHAGVAVRVRASAHRAYAAALRGDVQVALAAIESHQILCAHRLGPFGAAVWNEQARYWASPIGTREQLRAFVPTRTDPLTFSDALPPGTPIVVTQNDYDLKVYNGDTGVVVCVGGENVVAFRRSGEPLFVHPTRLPQALLGYAITVHRSQGSQYDAVTVILPDAESAHDATTLLTRELLYTAVTRARHEVHIIGTREAVAYAVERRVSRASGLAARRDS